MGKGFSSPVALSAAVLVLSVAACTAAPTNTATTATTADTATTDKQHYAFGADVLAVADATVVIVQDGEPEQVPNVKPVPQKSAELAGNLVVLEVEPDVYAAYVHLQPGSIAVKVGDKVTVGQHLARLGNSGNSTGAHLHFGLLDQANLFTGRSLPLVLEQFMLVGNVNFETSTGEHLVIAPKSKEVTRAYPLYGGILNFPGN